MERSYVSEKFWKNNKEQLFVGGGTRRRNS